jgi:integrase
MILGLSPTDSGVRFRRLTVAQVFDLFLEGSSRHNEARTYEWYRDFLQDFSDRYGALEAEKLKPFHVTRCLDSHQSWGEANRRCGTIAVKRAFNWADAEGILTPNPLKHVKKGPQKRRERILTADERQQILKAARGRPFRELVQASRRPAAGPLPCGRLLPSEPPAVEANHRFPSSAARTVTVAL